MSDYRWMCVIVAVALAASVATASDGGALETQPAMADKVTVVSVTGPAQKLVASASQPTWQPIQAREELDEMTVIRTGLRAKVVLRFADRGEVVVERATKAGISEFRRQAGTARTSLGLKYGSMRVHVEKARGPQDFEVSTPVATMSVRGTDGHVRFAGDLGLLLDGESGTWQVISGPRRRQVGAGDSTDSNLTKTGGIKQRRRYTPLGDTSGGLSKSEKDRLRKNHGGRQVFGFTPGAGDSERLVPTGSLPDSRHINGNGDDYNGDDYEYPGDGFSLIGGRMPG